MSQKDLIPKKAAAHAAARSEALSRSALARAEASEYFFWWRVAGLLMFFGLVGSMTIKRVQLRSTDIIATYQLETVNKQYLKEVERGRHLRTEIATTVQLQQLRDEGHKKGCVPQGSATGFRDGSVAQGVAP